MSGIVNLDVLLKEMEPVLVEGEFAFCRGDANFADYLHLKPIGLFREAEGVTMIVPMEQVRAAKLEHLGPFRMITLSVHSSLEAVGLTAAVAEQLSREGISANVVAAYYHDHIFVAADMAEQALAALRRI